MSTTRDMSSAIQKMTIFCVWLGRYFVSFLVQAIIIFTAFLTISEDEKGHLGLRLRWLEARCRVRSSRHRSIWKNICPCFEQNQIWNRIGHRREYFFNILKKNWKREGVEKWKEGGRVYYKKVGKSGKTKGILSGKIELSGVYLIWFVNRSNSIFLS